MHSTHEYTDPASLVRDGGATGTWTLDPSASPVDCKAKTFWDRATVSGRFQLVGGTAQVAPGGRIRAEVTISAASIQQPGDVLESRIEGIGTIRNQIIDRR